MKAWLSCIAASLFFFYVIVQLSLFNSISHRFMQDFSIGLPLYAITSSSFLYANALWLLPAGILYDRYSTRKLLVLFFLCTLIATFVFSVSHSIMVDIFCRIVEGTGSAFAFLGTLRLAGKWFPHQKMGLVISVMISLGMLGGVFGNGPLHYLVMQFGWRKAIALSGAMGFLFFILMLMFLQDPPNIHLNINSSFKNMWRNFLYASKKTQNWLVGLYIGFLNLPIMVIASLWGGLYLVHVKHLTMMDATSIASMIFVGEIVGSPLFGYCSDFIKKRKLPMILGTISALIFSIIIIYSKNSLLWLHVTFFMLGFSIAAQVIGYPVVVESNESTMSSTAQGFVSFSVNLIGGFFQIVFGFVQHLTASYEDAFLLIPGGCIIAVFVISFAKESFTARV